MKNLNHKFYILSDVLHSGKTTFLKEFARNNPLVDGFISPEISGKRHFQHLHSGETFLMENENGSLEIGRFRFVHETFEKVSEKFQKLMESDENEILILDEIGPLEVRKNQGFHSLLHQVVREQHNISKTIILVVRDHLLNEFTYKYPLEDAKIITRNPLTENSLQLPVGIVLAGGQSSRMHHDKALLQYHDKPQYEQVAELLRYFCSDVFISVNETQAKNISFEPYEILVDAIEFTGHGPMTGFMTAVQHFPGKPLFFAACDYPLLTVEHLFELIRKRDYSGDVTCFEKDGFPEPMISILEAHAQPALGDYFEKVNDSPVKFIRNVQAIIVNCHDCTFLKNINTTEEYRRHTDQSE